MSSTILRICLPSLAFRVAHYDSLANWDLATSGEVSEGLRNRLEPREVCEHGLPTCGHTLTHHGLLARVGISTRRGMALIINLGRCQIAMPVNSLRSSDENSGYWLGNVFNAIKKLPLHTKMNTNSIFNHLTS